MSVVHRLLPLAFVLATSACNPERDPPETPVEVAPRAAPAPAEATAAKVPEPVAAPPPPVAALPEAESAPPPTRQGERAPFVVEGDVVKVNNSLCAVSRSPMGPETLGRFVSRVEYKGADARFQGKTFEFNQCCGMCLESFPERWTRNADAILAFHGVDGLESPPR